jgi:uncharacterized oxidoreductase
MPTSEITREEMFNVSKHILVLNGTTETDAGSVAESLIKAEEVGHSSHGVIRLLEYTAFVKKGQVLPGVYPQIESDMGSAVTINGNWGWGQLACKLALQHAITNKDQLGVMGITIRHCNHIGRLGEYVETLAENKLASIMWCNADPAVAAYGGKSRVLGTNPFAVGIPTDEKPIVLDFATAGVAEGKLRVARAKGEKVREGLVIDKEGNPSTDPEDFYAGGALLPFGEHKGYGLSLIIDLLGGALSGNHPALNSKYQFGNGAVLLVINPAKFQRYEDFQADIVEASTKIRNSPPANNSYPILLPGDLENSIRAKNQSTITMSTPIWNSLLELEKELATKG